MQCLKDREHFWSSVMPTTLELWDLPFLKSPTRQPLWPWWFQGSCLRNSNFFCRTLILIFCSRLSLSRSCLFPYLSQALWSRASETFSLELLNLSTRFSHMPLSYVKCGIPQYITGHLLSGAPGHHMEEINLSWSFSSLWASLLCIYYFLQ